MSTFDVTFRFTTDGSPRETITAESAEKTLLPFLFPRLADRASARYVGSTITRVDDLVVWFLARCNECELLEPFRVEAERDEWADIHGRAFHPGTETFTIRTWREERQ